MFQVQIAKPFDRIIQFKEERDFKYFTETFQNRILGWYKVYHEYNDIKVGNIGGKSNYSIICLFSFYSKLMNQIKYVEKQFDYLPEKIGFQFKTLTLYKSYILDYPENWEFHNPNESISYDLRITHDFDLGISQRLYDFLKKFFTAVL